MNQEFLSNFVDDNVNMNTNNDNISITIKCATKNETANA